MEAFEYHQPTDLRDASLLLKRAGAEAAINSGGTDLLDLMKEGIATPKQLVNLKRIKGLRGIDYTKGRELRIGALTTLHEIATHPVIQERFTALSEAASKSASPQLRNMGTLGGNLCQRPRCWYFRSNEFPCIRKGGKDCFAVSGENKYHCVIGGGPCYIVHPSDPAVALVALDARVIIQNQKKRREVSIHEFFLLPEDDPTRETILEPGDIVTEVLIPEPASGKRSGYRKFMFRESWDFAVVSVAGVLRIEGGQILSGKITLGGVAPMPWTEEIVGAALPGMRIGAEEIARVSEVALSGAEPMGQNDYKVPLARNLIAEMLERLTA